jgi:hypothetical protein
MELRDYLMRMSLLTLIDNITYLHIFNHINLIFIMLVIYS